MLKYSHHSNNRQKPGSFSKKCMFHGLSVPAGMLTAQCSVPNLGSGSLRFYRMVIRKEGSAAWAGGEVRLSSEKSSADLRFLGQWGHLDKLMDCRAAQLLVFFSHRRQDRPFCSNLSHSAHTNGSFPSSKSSSCGLSKSPSNALQVQRHVINCMLAF